MGLSNYIPSSRVSQAGVCTSTTRPASPYEGQMIYETDTNRVLVYDNTAWVMIADTDAPPGLCLVKTDTIVNVSTKEITNAFSSDFTNYRIVLSNLTTSSGANIFFRFGTVITDYYGTYYYDLFTGGATGTVRKNNGAELQIGISSPSGIVIDVFEPNTSSAQKIISGTSYGGGYSGWFGGTLNSATARTSFLIGAAGVVIDTCNVAVYGYRN